MLQGITYKSVEMVITGYVEHVVHGVLPRPVPACGSALADVVGVGEGVIGELISQAVLTVGAGAHLVVELALPGEALDGLHTDVAGEGETVAVAVIVAAGRVDHAGDGVADIAVQGPKTAVAQPVILGIGTVSLINGDKRVGGHHVVDVIPVVVAGTDTAALVGHEGHVLTEGDDVETVFLPENVIGIEADGDTLVVGCNGFAEDTFLMGVGDTGGEPGAVGTADDVHGVVGVGSILVTDGVKPVGAGEGTVLDAVVKLGAEGVRPVDGIPSHVEVHLVLDVHVLLGVQELGHLLHVLDAVETVVCDGVLAGLALLGGHEDNTVCTTGTVDGAGCSVLEDVDALDVGGVQRIDVTSGNAVDDVQRSIGTGGTHTADVHVVAGTRLAVRAHDAHTGGGGLHGAERAGGVELCEFFTLHLDGGAGHQLFLLGTVTNHHKFFQGFGVFLKENVEERLVSDRDYLSLVTDG